MNLVTQSIATSTHKKNNGRQIVSKLDLITHIDI
jgi:hypothetical protein